MSSTIAYRSETGRKGGRPGVNNRDTAARMMAAARVSRQREAESRRHWDECGHECDMTCLYYEDRAAWRRLGR
jgi:hypothetical protein